MLCRYVLKYCERVSIVIQQNGGLKGIYFITPTKTGEEFIDFHNIPDPGSWLFVNPGSRIQKQQQKRGVKKISCPTFFAAKNITKLKIILFLIELVKKFVWPIYKEL
jgi:hypothetical protein